MHTRGRPEEWRAQPQLAPDELLATVRAGLAASLAAARRAGIAPESIVLDPGYGFGKRFEENYALLARQAELLALGRPLLAGREPQIFPGPHTGAAPCRQHAPSERETASIAALVAAILHGASIVRVHAVRPAVEAARSPTPLWLPKLGIRLRMVHSMHAIYRQMRPAPRLKSARRAR